MITILNDMKIVREMIAQIRTFRQQHNIPKHEKVDIDVIQGQDGIIPKYNSIIRKMGNVANINIKNQ